MRLVQAHDIDVSQINTSGSRITRADVEAHINGQKTQTPSTRVLASPKARRLARENSIVLAEIKGSGPDGAVLSDDVLNYEQAAINGQMATVETQKVQQAQTGVPRTGHMWRRMAERLTESWQTIPHFYLKREVSANALMKWRKSLLGRNDTKITYTDLLTKLVAVALKQHPHLNGQWNGEHVIFNEQVNIGLAVAVEEGLLVPVIHDADKLGVTAIAQRRVELVERSMSGKLRADDLQGGTFTISNLGMYGIDEFSAIVNPPQAAILAVGKIVEQVVPIKGNAKIHPMLTLNLSCDHRAVDGARGAQFLDTLANLIHDPMRLMD